MKTYLVIWMYHANHGVINVHHVESGEAAIQWVYKFVYTHENFKQEATLYAVEADQVVTVKKGMLIPQI